MIDGIFGDRFVIFALTTLRAGFGSTREAGEQLNRFGS
jgi:hypothetical protein